MVLGSYFGKPRRALMLHILDFIYRVSSNFDHIVLRKDFTLFFFLGEKNLMESFSFLPSIVLHPELEMDGGVIVFPLCLFSHTYAHVQADQSSTSRVSLPYSSQLNQELAHMGHWEWLDCSRALLCLSCPQITCGLPHPPNMSRGSGDLNSGNADWV